MKNMDDINKFNEIDQAYFWRLVNRQKKKSKTMHPLKLKNGDVISHPDDTRKTWKQYFEALYAPKDDTRYDKDFKKMVKYKIKPICRLIAL